MNHVITIGERQIPLHYGSNAMRALEKETGRTTQVIALLLVSGQMGLGMLQEILWAGIEGARMRLRLQQPYMSVDEVGDLIDSHPGGPATLWSQTGPAVKVLLDAWSDAFDIKKREGEVAPAPANPTPAAPSPAQAPTSGGNS